MDPSHSASVPLGLTGVLCDTRTISLPHGTLQYTVYRPRHLQYRPPLVCVAGGPLLPCLYLTPLAHLVTDRAIVLYDAIGCGQSPRSTSASHSDARSSQTSQTFVQALVLELTELVNALPCREYYLFGHSFGGMVVYQYLQRLARDPTTSSKQCFGAILSSVPVSIPDSQSHCQELLRTIHHEIGADAEPQQVSQVFCERYECRRQPLPLPLQQAFQSAGCISSYATAGLKAVSDYKVEFLEEDWLEHLPPALILRGEFDFVTEESCRLWLDAFRTAQCITLAQCSHYGMVEQEHLYGSVLQAFLQEHDPPMKPVVPLSNHCG